MVQTKWKWTNNKFAVHKMDQMNLKYTMQLEKAIKMHKKDEDGEWFKWSKVQWLHFKTDFPYNKFWKETLGEH